MAKPFDKAAADRRYQEKIRARNEGRAPAIVQAPAAPPEDKSPAAIEARYRAKLAARAAAAKGSKPDAKPAKPEPEVKPAEAAKAPEAKPTDAKPEKPAKK